MTETSVLIFLPCVWVGILFFCSFINTATVVLTWAFTSLINKNLTPYSSSRQKSGKDCKNEAITKWYFADDFLASSLILVWGFRLCDSSYWMLSSQTGCSMFSFQITSRLYIKILTQFYFFKKLYACRQVVFWFRCSACLYVCSSLCTSFWVPN